MATYQEIGEDARSDISAYSAYLSITDSQVMRWVTEAMHLLQRQSWAVRLEVQIPTADLDGSGKIDIPRVFTVPEKVYFARTGSSKARKVTLVDPDYIEQQRLLDCDVRMTYDSSSASANLIASLDKNKLTFYPAAGLSGVFVVKGVALMPRYSESRATQIGDMWYGWDADSLATKMAETELPYEFHDVEEEIVGYVAAKMIESIPGWRKALLFHYEERMDRFHGAIQMMIDNQPDYNINTQAAPNWGWGAGNV